MSSSSHKRRRSSQKSIRKLYGSHGSTDSNVSEAKEEEPSDPIAEMASLPSTRTSVSGPQPASLPTPVPPFITPFAKPTVPSTSSTTVPTAGPNDAPSILSASAATSDLSTSVSSLERPQPSPNTNHAAGSLLALSHARPRQQATSTQRPSNDTDQQPHPSSTDQTNPSVDKQAPSISFDLWHHRASVGQLQFGTQSSPQKALKLLPAMERSVTDGPNPPASASVTTATNPTPLDGHEAIGGASAPDTTTAVPTLRLTKAPPVAAARSSSANPNPQHHNLIKGKLKKITEGSYLIPLRRMQPLPCKNPGPAAKKNTPLILVAQMTDSTTKASLSLVANHCSVMMRKAKNYTAGVTRSPTGTFKQRRFNNKKNNKRKRGGIPETTISPVSNDDSTPRIQIVTSFALRTLFLEDLWFLKEGLPVAVFFHEETLPPRYSKKWLTVLGDTSQSAYVPTVTCQGRTYHQLTGWVLGNPDTKLITEGFKAYPDIFEALKEHHQHALHLKFPILSPCDSNLVQPPKECIQEDLTWFEVFHYPQSVFIQADYHPERNWLANFKTVKDNTDDRLTLLHRLVQETPGDRFMLAELRSSELSCAISTRTTRNKQWHKWAAVNKRKSEHDSEMAVGPFPFRRDSRME